MSKTKKKPPMKLAWAEACQGWIVRQAELPERISKAVAQAVVLRLMLSAASDGTGVLASARWVAKQTANNHGRVSRFLAFLVEHGWLADEGIDRTTQARRYRLTIPTSATDSVAPSADTPHAPSADDEPVEGVDQRSPLSVSPGVDQRSPLSFPKVVTKVVTSGPPLPTTEEVVEGGGASAPLPENTETAKLSAVEMGRLRGDLEQVAASRQALDAQYIREDNIDLQREWQRLVQRGWDAGTLDVALPHPRKVSSDTGWVLAGFRNLQTDPDEDARVIEAQMLLLAWMMEWCAGDEWAKYGISREESDRLFDLAHDLGYLDDHRWTEDGARLSRLVEDWIPLSEMGEYPQWGLVRQAMEAKSMKA